MSSSAFVAELAGKDTFAASSSVAELHHYAHMVDGVLKLYSATHRGWRTKRACSLRARDSPCFSVLATTIPSRAYRYAVSGS